MSVETFEEAYDNYRLKLPNRNDYYLGESDLKAVWEYQQKKIDRLKEQLDLKLYSRRKMEKEIPELESFCRELIEVVDFYAHKDNFVGSYREDDIELGDSPLIKRGKRARAIQQTEMYKRMKG